MNIAQEFDALFHAALALDLSGKAAEAALITVTRTTGSTFRRAGASMLVQRDGRLICELSGGCPQRDIILRSQRVMESDEPVVVSYGRESNFDVMLETGCGGELEVLIEPWSHPDDIAFLFAMEELRSHRKQGAMASLFTAQGGLKSDRPRRLIRGGGKTWTNIEQRALEQQILSILLSSGTSTVAVAQQFDLDGHRQDVLVEYLQPPHALVVVGDGSDASALTHLSVQLGWRTTLVTPAPTNQATHAGVHLLAATPEMFLSSVALDNLTSVVVMTHRLDRDISYVNATINSPANYIGVIGSRSRAHAIISAFPGEEARLHAPAGLDVGSETPQEIALAIAAEILAVRNNRTGSPLVHSQNSIHS
jgi:xanthine/CO dehydrogenase XdhC/CoxF family maturation factor